MCRIYHGIFCKDTDCCTVENANNRIDGWFRKSIIPDFRNVGACTGI